MPHEPGLRESWRGPACPFDGDPANVVLEILSPGKTADIIHEGRKKLFDRKGCEAMKVGISDAIQAKGAPHDHLLGEPH
jgi:hypothetical protein